MKVLYIPLDERPCNYEIPQHIVAGNENVDVLIPNLNLLGQKKVSAPMDDLWNFVEESVQDVDAAVLSIDTLLFGGLIPSRIHQLDDATVSSYLERLKNLKIINPRLKIYAFECIMRSPKYNSSEEEPDYYANYGYALHRRAYLLDKKERVGLSVEEASELNNIVIPNEFLEDYEDRRNFNLRYNLEVAKLVNERLIDFLVIPQDDSSEYGYTAIAQKQVVNYLSNYNLESRVNIYPGADEVGSSLLARCLNEIENRKTKVYAFYSSTLGPSIVPNYEDRPMHENLKYHIDVTDSILVNRPEEADFILAINSPGKEMEEAFDQEHRDISYTSHRNLLYFVKEIERYIKEGYPLALCDSAFSNGGDLQLIKFLDERNLIKDLLAYAGWNTNSNTLGTVLASSIYLFDQAKSKRYEHLVYRILEDVFYQSYVRQCVVNQYLPQWGISYYDFSDKQSLVEGKIEELLEMRYNDLEMSKTIQLDRIEVWMPWKRMFEIGQRIKIRY